jgi:hypothetical protein
MAIPAIARKASSRPGAINAPRFLLTVAVAMQRQIAIELS